MNVPEADHVAWLRKAANDLLNISNNLRAEQVPWDTVCFHAQQCAEKTLKAYLVFHGYQPQYTHNLVSLLASCAGMEPGLANLQDDCQLLVGYGVHVRYPDEYEVMEDDSRQAVTALERIRARLLPLIPAATDATAGVNRDADLQDE